MAGGAAAGRLLPFGTANVLAREIGLPRDPERLAELIAHGAARPIWPGRVGDRLFLTMASSGFDAETVAAVNPRLKRHIGRFAFAWAILRVRCAVSRPRTRYSRRRHRASRRHGDRRERPILRRLLSDRAAGQTSPSRCSISCCCTRSGRFAVLRYLASLLLGRLPQCRDIIVLRSPQRIGVGRRTGPGAGRWRDRCASAGGDLDRRAARCTWSSLDRPPAMC